MAVSLAAISRAIPAVARAVLKVGRRVDHRAAHPATAVRRALAPRAARKAAEVRAALKVALRAAQQVVELVQAPVAKWAALLACQRRVDCQVQECRTQVSRARALVVVLPAAEEVTMRAAARMGLAALLAHRAMKVFSAARVAAAVPRVDLLVAPAGLRVDPLVVRMVVLQVVLPAAKAAQLEAFPVAIKVVRQAAQALKARLAAAVLLARPDLRVERQAETAQAHKVAVARAGVLGR